MKQEIDASGFDLNSLFGEETAQLALRVLTVVDANAGVVYSAFELLEAAGIESPMEGFLVLARLTNSGLLAHPGLGLYASTVAGLQAVAGAA